MKQCYQFNEDNEYYTFKKEIKEFIDLRRFVNNEYNDEVRYDCKCGCGGDDEMFMDSVDKLQELNCKYKWLLNYFNFKGNVKETFKWLKEFGNNILETNKNKIFIVVLFMNESILKN